MIRPGIAALCYLALLVAVTDDWIATQTGSKEDGEAALLDNDFLPTPLVSHDLLAAENTSDTSPTPNECLAIPVADIYSSAEPLRSVLMSIRC